MRGYPEGQPKPRGVPVVLQVLPALNSGGVERGTVEMTFPIVEKARGAVFYDTGFVNPDPWDFSKRTLEVPRGLDARASNIFFGRPDTPRKTYDNIASDVGVGVRLDLPIGPLRLDYGIPLQTSGNKKSGHLNFSVGYQF